MHLAALHFSTILVHFLVKPHMKSNFHVQNHEFKKKTFQKMLRLIKAKFIQVSICFHLSQSPFCMGVLLAAAYAKKMKDINK